MQTEHRIVRAVYGAKESADQADELIRSYIPFIRSEASKFMGRLCTEQDDEYLKTWITYDMMNHMSVPTPLCSWV